MQLHEDLGDRLRQPLVEREAFAAPVAGGAEALELADDRAARLGLPFPNAREKCFSPERAAVRLLALGKLALDHHLRRDARVVGARLPEHVPALHAMIAAQDVLQRVVERVAHVQVAGDVGRRDHHAERLGVGALRPAGAKGAFPLPERGDARLDGGGIERLFHHLAWPRLARAEHVAATVRRVEDYGARLKGRPPRRRPDR